MWNSVFDENLGKQKFVFIFFGFSIEYGQFWGQLSAGIRRSVLWSNKNAYFFMKAARHFANFGSSKSHVGLINFRLDQLLFKEKKTPIRGTNNKLKEAGATKFHENA